MLPHRTPTAGGPDCVAGPWATIAGTSCGCAQPGRCPAGSSCPRPHRAGEAGLCRAPVPPVPVVGGGRASPGSCWKKKYGQKEDK